MDQNLQSSEDYKLMLEKFSQQEDENERNNKQNTLLEKSGFDVLKEIGEGDKNWLKATHENVTYSRTSKEGKLHLVFDWMKEEVDNARFKAGKRPFFGSEYLWAKADTFPWVDTSTGQPKLKCPNGLGHKEMFNAMVENNDVENQLDCSDYNEKLAEEYSILVKNNFPTKV